MIESICWIRRKAGNNIYSIMILVFLQSIFSLSGIAYALLFRLLVDAAGNGSVEGIQKYSLYFLIVLFMQSMISAAIRRLQEAASVNIENTLKRNMLSEIFERDFSCVSDVHSGEWMNKITSDISVVSRNVVHLLPNLCGILVQIVATVIVLSSLVPSYLIVLLFVIAFGLALESFYYRRIKYLHKEVQEKDGLLRIFIQECLNSLIVIKSYAKEKELLNESDQFQNEYKNARLKKNWFSVVMNFFFGAGMNGLLIFSGIYCTYRIMKNEMSYGTLIAVLQIITQVRSPIANAYGNIPNFYSLLGSIERLKEIEDYDLDKKDRDIDINYFYNNDFKGFDIKDVSFVYKNKREHIISGLSLSIEKGDYIAISGPSGCGKSTLFKLLLTLYKPLSGEIDIIIKNGNIELNSNYRSLFAYVPQDNQLMKGSIKEVICFYKDYDEERMRNALSVSCCDEFVSRLEDGIETQLKEKGYGLSEGQMQRIAIARAIYSDHPVLLLDEVTSSLNEELELKILNNIKKQTDKTILLITHHKNTLSYADKRVTCFEEEGKYLWQTEEN